MKELKDYQIEDQVALALTFIEHCNGDFVDYMKTFQYDSLSEAEHMFRLCRESYNNLVINQGMTKERLSDILVG